MSAAVLSLDSTSPGLPYGWMWRTARRILLTGGAIASAGVLIEWPRVALLIWPVPLTTLTRLASTMFLEQLVWGLAIGACLESYWWMRDTRRTGPQKIIAAAVIPLSIALVALVTPLLPLQYPLLVEYGLVGSLHAFWLFLVWHDLAIALISIIYLVRKRQIFAEDTRIARANREWERARRAVLESRLQAIQARVEPQLLFDSLARMREYYQVTVEQGEELLDALIDFLRCGLPHMRSATGTIFLECELLKSYALLLRAAAFSRPILICDLDPQAASMTIAAGGLQGLVAPWLRCMSADKDEHLEIVARRTRDGLSIKITGPSADLTPAVVATQQTLREVHGARSSITQRQSGARLECRIEYSDELDHPVSMDRDGGQHA